MTIDTLRYLDKFIGLPVCWLLTVFRFLFTFFTKKSNNFKAPHKILIIKLSEMGSSVFLYPVFLKLKDLKPETEIFILTFEMNRSIFDEMQLVDPAKIFSIRTNSLTDLISSGYLVLKRLMAENFYGTIDFDFFSRFTAIIAFIVCRGKRVGFHRFTSEGLGRGNLLTDPVTYSPHIHTSQAFLALIHSFCEGRQAIPQYQGPIEMPSGSLPEYVPDGEALHRIKNMLEKFGISGMKREKIVLVNPNSSEIFPLRKWPLENFAKYCSMLLSKHAESFIIITGNEAEQIDAQRILSIVGDKRLVSFAGRTTFKELLALYTLADFMVTNDSGPAHFASLARLPAIVLFGPETPKLYSPLGNRSTCLYAGFACSPCVSVYNGKKSPCKNNLCLQAISVQTVVNESLLILNGKTVAEDS